MVDEEGRVKVLDFGLAKWVSSPLGDGDGPRTRSLTEDGRVMGTVPYMSPEQVQGRLVDARADVFSLGVMLYEMAAGRRPFTGRSSAEVMAAVQRDDAEALDAVRGDLPRRLGRIVQRCLEKDPDRRYPTASDVRVELVELSAELGSGATSVGAVSRSAVASGTVSGGTAPGAAPRPAQCRVAPCRVAPRPQPRPAAGPRAARRRSREPWCSRPCW